MSESLGDLLKKRQEQDFIERELRLRAEQEAAAQKKRDEALAKIKLIDDYFDDIKKQVTEALLAGNKLPHIGLPEDHNHKIYALIHPTGRLKSCYEETNVGYGSWKQFKLWAEMNGMHVWWETDPYEHTPGYTSYTWCTLHFKPL